jgi:hypothetical protein
MCLLVFLPAVASQPGLARAHLRPVADATTSCGRCATTETFPSSARGFLDVRAEGSRVDFFVSQSFASHSAATADLSVLFAGAPRSMSSCKRLILWKAIFTNQAHNVSGSLVNVLTISPNRFGKLRHPPARVCHDQLPAGLPQALLGGRDILVVAQSFAS